LWRTPRTPVENRQYWPSDRGACIELQGCKLPTVWITPVDNFQGQVWGRPGRGGRVRCGRRRRCMYCTVRYCTVRPVTQVRGSFRCRGVDAFGAGAGAEGGLALGAAGDEPGGTHRHYPGTGWSLRSCRRSGVTRPDAGLNGSGFCGGPPERGEVAVAERPWARPATRRPSRSPMRQPTGRRSARGHRPAGGPGTCRGECRQ
jgi:hypothetical protein